MPPFKTRIKLLFFALAVALAVFCSSCESCNHKPIIQQGRLISQSIFPLTRDYLAADTAMVDSSKVILLDAMKTFEDSLEETE